MVLSLREHIEIKRNQGVADGQGGILPDAYTTIATCFAHIKKSATRRDYLSLDNLRQRDEYSVSIRENRDILPSDLILWDGIYYSIQTISHTKSQDFYTTILMVQYT